MLNAVTQRITFKYRYRSLKKIIIFFLLIFKVQDIACPQSTISPLVFPLPYKLKADVFINEKEGI